jgi:phosphoribosylanthranilate isomerase
MQVRVKICGITRLDDALAAVDAGADAIGFVFFPESPRYLPLHDAASIIQELPPFITTVGVFVNEKPDQIERMVIRTGVDLIQLHGDEQPHAHLLARRVIKAIRVKNRESLYPLGDYQGEVCAFLLDTYTPDVFGGTGQTFNWDIAIEAKKFGRIILAGGLTPDNVTEAVRRVKPYGVDVSSGVELSKGRKDRGKLRAFIEKAKSVQTIWE